MLFRATNAANWSSIIRIGAKMAVIRRRIARRAVSSHTQRAGKVPSGESRIKAYPSGSGRINGWWPRCYARSGATRLRPRQSAFSRPTTRSPTDNCVAPSYCVTRCRGDKPFRSFRIGPGMKVRNTGKRLIPLIPAFLDAVFSVDRCLMFSYCSDMASRWKQDRPMSRAAFEARFPDEGRLCPPSRRHALARRLRLPRLRP